MEKEKGKFLIKDINQDNSADIYVNQKNIIIFYADASPGGVPNLNVLEEVLGGEFNLEVDESGEVRLNSEKMEVKELSDGSRVFMISQEDIKRERRE